MIVVMMLGYMSGRLIWNSMVKCLVLLICVVLLIFFGMLVKKECMIQIVNDRLNVVLMKIIVVYVLLRLSVVNCWNRFEVRMVGCSICVMIMRNRNIMCFGNLNFVVQYVVGSDMSSMSSVVNMVMMIVEMRLYGSGVLGVDYIEMQFFQCYLIGRYVGLIEWICVFVFMELKNMMRYGSMKMVSMRNLVMVCRIMWGSVIWFFVQWCLCLGVGGVVWWLWFFVVVMRVVLVMVMIRFFLWV